MKPVWYVSGKPLQESFQRRYLLLTMSLLVAQTVKNPPAMQETWVLCLVWEDLLEKEMGIHSSILAWRIPWTEKPGGLQSMGSKRIGHDWVTNSELMLLNCGVGEDSWESLGLQGDPTSPSKGGSVMGVHWKDWWSWNSNTLATWCKELTHWKRPWCWERLRAGGEGDNRGWDGWMASPTQWTWVWVDSGWTGRPGVLRFMGSQRVRHDWATELKWTEWLTH